MENEESVLLEKTQKVYAADGETSQPEDGVFTYEESLSAVGIGKFHVLLLVLCGWAVSSDSVEILSVSFLLPSATCDLQMTSEAKGWLSATVFLGMMVGGYGWGSLADHGGRRSVLLWSLMVNGVGALLSSLAQQFWLFLIFRFVSGVGVGGSMPVIFTYFAEFQSKDWRGAMISALATFWMAGNILAAGLAWLVIPHYNLGYFSSNFRYDSWRIYVAICTIPSLTSAALFLCMPESPKFLLKRGKEEQAIIVLKKVHQSNQCHTPFNIRRLVMWRGGEGGREERVSLQESEETQSSCCSALCSMLDLTLELFRPSLRTVTCILVVINFTICFGYYGLFMWFPEIFNRIEKNGGTICQPYHTTTNTTNVTTISNNNDSTNTETVECEEVQSVVYVEGFLTAVSNLPGNLLTIFLMDRIGRKALLASSMVLSGLSTFFLWFVHVRWQSVLMSCVFGAVSIIGFNALDVLQPELYPTHIRSTAFGFQTGVMRLGAIAGNLLFGTLVDAKCMIPMLMVAALMSIGGLVSLILPNTTNIDIH